MRLDKPAETDRVRYLSKHRTSEGTTLLIAESFARLMDFVVYNTETRGALHGKLSRMKNYICSDYFGDAHKSGDFVDGVRHEDLMDLSLEDTSVDLVISSDVFEHVTLPYRAHEEVCRILRRGGRHIFTVPFSQTEFLDEERTNLDDNGRTVFLKEPMYHEDPLRPEGALVHTIFAIEMLVKLRRIGFSTYLYHLRRPWNGILGSNAIVFEAIKV